jgi:hypothetical protein
MLLLLTRQKVVALAVVVSAMTANVATARVAIPLSVQRRVANPVNHANQEAPLRRPVKSPNAHPVVIVRPADPVLRVQRVPRDLKARRVLNDQHEARARSAQVDSVVLSVPLAPSNLP